MRVAVIGRREITDEETADLKYLGKMMARRGLELITNGRDGTAATVQDGYESLNLPGASSTVMRDGIFEYADKVIVYTDSDIDHILTTKGVFEHPKLVRIDGVVQLRRFLDEVALVMQPTTT